MNEKESETPDFTDDTDGETLCIRIRDIGVIRG